MDCALEDYHAGAQVLVRLCRVCTYNNTYQEQVVLADTLLSRFRLHMHKANLTRNDRADCDWGDKVGCEAGLTCGQDNCAQFHEIGASTGFNPSSDCCEGKTP